MESNLIFVTAVLVVALLVIINKWNDLKNEHELLQDELADIKSQKASAPSPNNNIPPSNIGTRDLFMQILTNIGCQYQLGEGNDTRIFFAYQGEHFFADCNNEAKYVWLYDTFWGRIEMSDIDEISRLRRSINMANLHCGVTTVFTIDNDGQNMNVHCKSIIPFHSQMGQLEDYLRIELNDYFRAHQILRTEMNKLREKENAD